MSLTGHYNEIWNRAVKAFENGQFEVDPLIHSAADTRYGITLLVRPSEQVAKRIFNVLEKLKSIEPDLYYYPECDLHVTVLSVISCCSGFSVSEINPDEYVRLIRSVVQSVTPFEIRFRGITASPSCLLVQGFPEDGQLKRMRDKLRSELIRSGLRHSIDQRYYIRTAHMTVARFSQKPSAGERFVRKVATLRGAYFGSCTVHELELVTNDWYLRKDHVKRIGTFALNSSYKD